MSVPACSPPQSWATRSVASSTPSSSSNGRPSDVSEKATRGFASARPVRVSLTARVSGATDFKNFTRTGALKNKSRTSTVVPGCRGNSSTVAIRPPLILTRVPASPTPAHVSSVTRATDAIEGSASPRKPNVFTVTRSAAATILLVACRSKQRRASSRPIPEPSSLTRMRRLPPRSTATATRVAPASSAFSTSSFTTDAGRSTASPAAI